MRDCAEDPTSGCLRVRYYQTDGESAQVSLDFLYWAMMRDERPELMPMAGVPEVLVLDNGPGNRSAAMLNACQELGIEHRTHLPHHAWAKGGVERSMDIWQDVFESELRIWPAKTLDDLNARATQSLYQFCTTRIHRRHKMTRSAFYAKFCPAEGLIMPPPYERYIEAATCARTERTVSGDGLISYDGREYYVGELAGVTRGSKVLVAKSVLAWDDSTRPVRIYAGNRVRVELALARDDRGNYSDQRLYTKRQDGALEAHQAAQELRMATPMPADAPQVDLAGLPAVEVPKARLRAVPQIALPTCRRVAAMMDLAKRLGRELSEFEVAGLAWGETVTFAQIETAEAALTRKVGSEPTRAAVG